MNKLKLFIRVTSSAMLVAFVFGMVAFVKANKNGELNTLYKVESTVAKESISKTNEENFSSGNLNIIEIKRDSIDISKVENNKVKVNANKPKVQKNTFKKKTFIPKRKYAKKNISFKSFSRGSLEIAPIRKVEKISE